jgi:biopolymer transport protein ExbD
MGMEVSSGGRPRSDINVVPLIDIVLVLLIIFMVLTPMMQRGYDMSIPEKAEIAQPTAPTEQIIVTITPDGRVLLNKETVEEHVVKTRIEELLRGRREKTVFFQAHNDVVYQKAITTMDAIRAAGGTVGLVTTELSQ